MDKRGISRWPKTTLKDDRKCEMTVNVKEMTVNVTFFITLSMTKKDHCKRYHEVEYDRKRLPSNSKHCNYSLLIWSSLFSHLCKPRIKPLFKRVGCKSEYEHYLLQSHHTQIFNVCPSRKYLMFQLAFIF